MIGLLSAAANSQTVYKSVDANGNIVYSDAPVENTVLIETLNLRSASNDTTAQQQSDARIEQMANVTERLKQDRESRKKALLEEEERELARQRAETPPLIYREEYDHGYYPYRSDRPYQGRYPYRPDTHKRPRYSPGLNSDHNLNNDAILVPRSKLLTPGPGE